MVNSYTKIFEDLESLFSVDKIRKDLHSYYGDIWETPIPIYSYSITNDPERDSYFDKDDPITILGFKMVKRYQGLSYLPFFVEIAIGGYSIDGETGIEQIDKFKAELMYDDNFEMVTIDYTH